MINEMNALKYQYRKKNFSGKSFELDLGSPLRQLLKQKQRNHQRVHVYTGFLYSLDQMGLLTKLKLSQRARDRIRAQT